MNITDIHEIIEFQLYRYRVGLFATTIVNFFIPTFWALASNQGGLSFTAWEWAVGFSVTLFGQVMKTHDPAFSMLFVLALSVVAAVASLISTRVTTLLAAASGGLGFLLLLHNANLVRADVKESIPGVVEVSFGSGIWWIGVPLLMGALLSAYPFLTGSGEVFFEGRTKAE